MKKENIFWGLLFIAAAVWLILSPLGLLGPLSSYGPAWIVISIILAAIAVKSLFTRSFVGFFFPVALIVAIYKEPLHLESVSVWTFLLTALLLSIGFSMIFSKKNSRRREFEREFHNNEVFTKTSYDSESDAEFAKNTTHDEDSYIFCSTKFSSETRYVDSQNFQKASIDVAFGGVKMYLDKAGIEGDSASIDVNISFGGVELYVPKSWRVENKVHAFLGGVEEKQGILEPEEKRIILTGNTNFGGLTIIYI